MTMPLTSKFKHLNVGDTVTMTIAGRVNGEKLTITVGGIFLVLGVGTAYVTSDDGVHLISESDVGTIEHLSWATVLPNSFAITWATGERDRHVAFQYGHPGNKCWLYEGDTYSSEDILRMAGSCPIRSLDLRS